MLHRLNDEKREVPTNRILRCPRCGLDMEITRVEGKFALEYDFATWHKLCGEPDLGSPSLCLMHHGAPEVAAGPATPESVSPRPLGRSRFNT